MYIPPQFEESRVEVLHQLIRSYSLGTLVTLSASGIEANHIPFHLTPEPTPFGTLQGHVARANIHGKVLREMILLWTTT